MSLDRLPLLGLRIVGCTGIFMAWLGFDLTPRCLGALMFTIWMATEVLRQELNRLHAVLAQR